MYLIVDGHPAHRARTAQDYVASIGGRLRLFRLPGYLPELNPGEWVWKNVKNDRIARAGITSKDDPQSQGHRRPAPLQKLPALARGFFAGPPLRYITATAD